MIIFYHGQDSYRLRKAVQERAASMPATIADMSTPEGREAFERALKYPSLLGEPTLLVARNIFADAATALFMHELLEEHHVAKASDITMIACQEGRTGRESSATKALGVYLAKNAQETAEFASLTGVALEHWARAFCAERGCSISSEACRLVINRTQGDSWALATELEKACAYTGEGTIAADTVRLLVPEQHEQDDFALSNAIAARDKRGALSSLFRGLADGTSEFLLLNIMAHAVRTMLARTGSSYTGLLRAHHALARLDRAAKDGLRDAKDGLFDILIGLS